MDVTASLPSSDAIRKQVRLCREELAELKKLLRAALSAERAQAARMARTQQNQEESNAQKYVVP